jgi:toxin ParE1/3/4
MKVEISAAAEADLVHIGEYIGRDSIARAASFVQELLDACEALSEVPFSFPVVSRYRTLGFRRKLHGNYLIFYRVREDRVEVARIVHGARDIDRLLTADDS